MNYFRTFAPMKKYILLIFTLIATAAIAQDDPTFVPTIKVSKVLNEGDSIKYVELSNVYVIPEPEFKTEKQRRDYNRLVYNVKKVLPIAKEVNNIIIETYEYLQTLPDKKSKDAHMKRVEQRENCL